MQPREAGHQVALRGAAPAGGPVCKVRCTGKVNLTPDSSAGRARLCAFGRLDDPWPSGYQVGKRQRVAPKGSALATPKAVTGATV
jgi:hypothetical protein